MERTILGLRTVVYNVGDLMAAKEWYARAFKTEPYFDENFYVGFDIGSFELGLLPEENTPEYKAESAFVYWGVNDIHSEFDHFIGLGATVHEAPHSVGDPLLVASVRDPWNNIIGLIFNPVFKYVPPEK